MDTDAAGSPRRRRQPAGAVRLTDRDHALLAFASRHRLILSSQAQSYLGLSAARTYARLRGLASAGLLAREPAHLNQSPGCYQITTKGLRAIGSPLRKPRFDLATYEHDVGLGWLYVAAKAGCFGPLRDVVSERQLRSQDARPDRQERAQGVRLGGYGPGGRERIHYPDLVLHTATGHRVAIELELTGKTRTRREQILAGYAADGRIDAVIYLSPNASIRQAIKRSARQIGISSLIHVQPVTWSPSARAGGAGAAHSAARTSGPARAAQDGR